MLVIVGSKKQWFGISSHANNEPRLFSDPKLFIFAEGSKNICQNIEKVLNNVILTPAENVRINVKRARYIFSGNSATGFITFLVLFHIYCHMIAGSFFPRCFSKSHDRNESSKKPEREFIIERGANHKLSATVHHKLLRSSFPPVWF